MRCSLVGVVAVALALSAVAARADDVNKAEEKLAKAREAYSAALSGIRDDVLKLIDNKDAAERNRANPDLAKLKTLKAEKEALEKNSEMPRWLDAKTKQRIAKAPQPLLDALIEAKAAYVRANDDEKADAIDKEIEQVKKGEGSVAAPSKDLFQKDSVWKGKRSWTVGSLKNQQTAFELHITDRKGAQFSGYTVSVGTQGGKHEHDIAGEVKDGKVEWRVVSIRGNGKMPSQPHKGSVRANTMDLTFDGLWLNNERVAGRTELTLQK